jgi:hypothetical protein
MGQKLEKAIQVTSDENKSNVTTLRILELESLGFEWGICVAAWEDRLSKLADCRKIHGHCNAPRKNSENSKLGTWVGSQRNKYRLHLKRKKSFMTLSRIQDLENLGFEWKPSIGLAFHRPSLRSGSNLKRLITWKLERHDLTKGILMARHSSIYWLRDVAVSKQVSTSG